MSQVLTFTVDLLAISLMVFALYFRRHRRADMVVAFLGVNVGVLAVAVALSRNTALGAGFGLGLFGALSIIRLRSNELGHIEVAYYFAALALGLISGIEVEPLWLVPVLSAIVVLAMAIGDSPRLFSSYRHQIVTLDRAYTDETQIKQAVEALVGGRVLHLVVQKLDQVNDTTIVDVRYRVSVPSA